MTANWEQRLARLEHENRWLKRIGGLIAAALVIVMLAAGSFPTEDVVEGRVFILRDAANNERAVLGVNDEDDVVLTLRRPDGTNVVKLMARADGRGALTIWDLTPSQIPIPGREGVYDFVTPANVLQVADDHGQRVWGAP